VEGEETVGLSLAAVVQMPYSRINRVMPPNRLCWIMQA